MKPGRYRAWLALALVYWAAAMFMTGIVLRTEWLPTGQSQTATVPLFNSWILAWNCDRAGRLWNGYWNAPIFYPEVRTLALSEPQPTTMIAAPLVRFGGSPVLAYNFYLLAMLVGNGLAATYLLRSIHRSWRISILGGLAVLLHPLAHQDLEVVQTVALWPALWCLAVTAKMRFRAELQHGPELAAALVCSFMVSMHQGLLFVSLFLLTLPVMRPRTRHKTWFTATLIAVVLFAITLGTFILPMRVELTKPNRARSHEVVQQLSATWENWLTAELRSPQWSYEPSDSTRQVEGGQATGGQGKDGQGKDGQGKDGQGKDEFTGEGSRTARGLLPGYLRLVLAMLGIWQLRHRRYRAIRNQWLVIGGVAWIASFGANLVWGGWSLWEWLCQMVPGYQHIRSAYRFAYFAQLIVLLLSACGAAECYRIWRSHFSGGARLSRRAEWLSLLLWAFLGWVTIFEVLPSLTHYSYVSSPKRAPGWVEFLQEQPDQNRSVLCLPWNAGWGKSDFEQTTRFMLWGLEHGKPLANGYSGYFPESWNRLDAVVPEAPFEDAAVSLYRELHVGWVMIDRRLHPQEPSESDDRWELVFRERDDYSIWRLSGSE